MIKYKGKYPNRAESVWHDRSNPKMLLARSNSGKVVVVDFEVLHPGKRMADFNNVNCVVPKGTELVGPAFTFLYQSDKRS